MRRNDSHEVMSALPWRHVGGRTARRGGGSVPAMWPSHVSRNPDEAACARSSHGEEGSMNSATWATHIHLERRPSRARPRNRRPVEVTNCRLRAGVRRRSGSGRHTRETSESPIGPDRSSGTRTIFLSLRKTGRAVRLTSAAIRSHPVEIGITAFAETTPDPATGQTIDPGTRLSHLMEEIKVADEVGLEVFAVGEHHRPDFAVSSPAVVLGAAAAITERIRLASAGTVLSTDDPVRVFEDFATIDVLSKGRAEIWAGRGSFTESFPLFGYNLQDYDELFAERLELLLKIRESERVTWSGKHRAAIGNLGVYPRPVQDPLPVWLAVGRNPGSAIRAGALGLPLALA